VTREQVAFCALRPDRRAGGAHVMQHRRCASGQGVDVARGASQAQELLPLSYLLHASRSQGAAGTMPRAADAARPTAETCAWRAADCRRHKAHG